jgi:hypothetical protein
MPEIISRPDSVRRSLPRFFTGKLCRHGHISERLTCNHDCLQCLAERSRRRRSEKPKEKSAANAQYYSENRDAVLAINANWRSINADRMKAIRRAHYAANRAAYNARSRMREAHIDMATPPWADLMAIRRVYETAARLTVETGIPHEVDHIFPLRAANSCGLHVHWNLQAIPANMNRAKGNGIRQWVCSDCGESHDRDINAARNILRVGTERRPPGVEIPVV